MSVRTALAVCLFIAVVVLLAMHRPAAMPSCQEDEIVVGVGDYDAGYWDAYVCQHFE